MPFDVVKHQNSQFSQTESSADDSHNAGCCSWCKRKKKPSHAAIRLTANADTAQDAPPAPSSAVVSLEAAAEMLPLRSKKERMLVTKALEQEMTRRRRWRQLMRERPSLVAAGPASKAESYFPPLPEDNAKEDIIEPTEEGPLVQPVALDDDKSINLDDQRRRWIEKMQMQVHVPEPSNQRPDEQQPDSLIMDEEAAQEIASHTLVNMLKKIIVAMALKEAIMKEKGKKNPANMSPDELVDLRRRDPAAWDDFVSGNSVASFGLAKPTPDDEARARKLLAKNHEKRSDSFSRSASDQRDGSRRSSRPRIHFDDQVEVFTVPVGTDFDPSEKVTANVDTLKKA